MVYQTPAKIVKGERRDKRKTKFFKFGIPLRIRKDDLLHIRPIMRTCYPMDGVFQLWVRCLHFKQGKT